MIPGADQFFRFGVTSFRWLWIPAHSQLFVLFCLQLCSSIFGLRFWCCLPIFLPRTLFHFRYLSFQLLNSLCLSIEHYSLVFLKHFIITYPCVFDLQAFYLYVTVSWFIKPSLHTDELFISIQLLVCPFFQFSQNLLFLFSWFPFNLPPMSFIWCASQDSSQFFNLFFEFLYPPIWSSLVLILLSFSIPLQSFSFLNCLARSINCIYYSANVVSVA